MAGRRLTHSPTGPARWPVRGTARRATIDAMRLVLTLQAGVMVAGDALAQNVYRYEDGGRVTYQDRAPSSVQDNGHSIMSNRGVVVEKVLSRQERRAERNRERALELSRIRDRALLATFTSEQDLVRTRDDRLGMIDGLIGRLDDRIRILSDRLAIVDKRVQMQERSMGEGAAQDSLYRERQGIRRNIENAWSLIDSKATERDGVAEKFDDDLDRYRELQAGRR